MENINTPPNDINAGYQAHLDALRAEWPDGHFQVVVRVMLGESAPGRGDRMSGIFQMADVTPEEAVQRLKNSMAAEAARRDEMMADATRQYLQMAQDFAGVIPPTPEQTSLLMPGQILPFKRG